MEHLNQSAAYAELGPNPRSTSTAPAAPPRKPSAKTITLIGELGLRYSPSAQADREAHSAALALLTRDLADVPPSILAQAIDQWVRQSRFMPKASELVELCKAIVCRAMPEPQPSGHLSLYAIDREEHIRRSAARSQREVEEAIAWVRRVKLDNGYPVSPLPPPLSRDELDRMTPETVAMGLKYGFLRRVDGRLVEAPLLLSEAA